MSFRGLLEDIYNGANKELLELNHYKFRSKAEIDAVLKKYSDQSASKCKLCEKDSPKHQEFPGWLGDLNFNQRGKIENKNIIIFGLEPAPKESVKKVLRSKYNFPNNRSYSYLHVWYELGYDTSVDDLIHNEKYGNHLFRYLSIFLDPLDHYIERIYGTDLAKCFTDKKNKHKARKICSEEYLPRELGCFENSELIFIMLGRSSKKCLKQFFTFKHNDDFRSFLEKNHDQIGEFGITYNSQEYGFQIGHFESNESKRIDLNGKYLWIPHPSGQTTDNWNKFLDHQDDELCKEIIHRVRIFLSSNS